MKKILLIIFFLFYPLSVMGATYYVSTTGSGSTCSSGSPCTAAYAMANATGANTWIFANGTYTAAPASWNVPAFNPTGSGVSDGSRLIFQAANPLGAVLQMTNTASATSALFGAHSAGHTDRFITWDGFKVDASNMSTSYSVFGAMIDAVGYVTIQNCEIIGHTFVDDDESDGVYINSGGSSHNIKIINNKIHEFVAGGASGMGIKAFDTTNITIQGNSIYNNHGGINLKQNNSTTTITLNDIYSNEGPGILLHLQGGNNDTDNSIYQNIIRSATGSLGYPGGIACASDAETQANLKIYNNVFYQHGDDEGSIGHCLTTSTAEIFNNIIWDTNGNTIMTDGRLAGSVPAYQDYNIFWTGTGGDLEFFTLRYAGTNDYTSLASWQATGKDTNSVNQNPSFVSAGTDFHLSGGAWGLTHGRGGSYASVMGAYITGSETIGYSVGGGGTTPSPVTGIKITGGARQ